MLRISLVHLFNVNIQSKLGYMASDIDDVKATINSEIGNPLRSLHGLLFPITAKRSFEMHHTPDSMAPTTTFVIPAVEQWLGQ